MTTLHGVKPILVFDGRNLPSKADTERKRRENRQRYKALAVQYLREGRAKEAGECFRRCVDITPAMAREVIQACQERNVDWYVRRCRSARCCSALRQGHLFSRFW